MTKIETLINTDRFSKNWKNITNLQPSEFKETIQTKSSVQSIASSLNEMEISNLKERGDWHGNRKYPYPFWKICEQCEKIFPAISKEQAKRNKTCSRSCRNKQVSEKSPEKSSLQELDHMKEIECSYCEKNFFKRRDRICDERGNFCSRNCYFKWQKENEKLADHMREIRPEGRTWTEEQKEEQRERMKGSSNPNWKGGKIYQKTGTNYKNPILIRCPEDYSEMARKDGYVLEHRLKVAKEIGRSLKSEEVVHHIDHDPQNNNIENLMLFESNQDHTNYHRHGKPAPIWQPSSQ